MPPLYPLIGASYARRELTADHWIQHFQAVLRNTVMSRLAYLQNDLEAIIEQRPILADLFRSPEQ